MKNGFQLGYILLIVLIFLQIFSMLSLVSFLSIKSILKQNIKRRIHDNNLLLAKTLLNEIEHHFLPSNCLISVKGAKNIAILPMNWWYLNGCKRQFNHFMYYYVIEFLGNDPCSFIQIKNSNQLLTADFYKITLMVDWKYKKILLQSTIVNAKDSLLTCRNKLHKVKIGRQMWRELRND